MKGKCGLYLLSIALLSGCNDNSSGENSVDVSIVDTSQQVSLIEDFVNENGVQVSATNNANILAFDLNEDITSTEKLAWGELCKTVPVVSDEASVVEVQDYTLCHAEENSRFIFSALKVTLKANQATSCYLNSGSSDFIDNHGNIIYQQNMGYVYGGVDIYGSFTNHSCLEAGMSGYFVSIFELSDGMESFLDNLTRISFSVQGDVVDSKYLNQKMMLVDGINKSDEGVLSFYQTNHFDETVTMHNLIIAFNAENKFTKLGFANKPSDSGDHSNDYDVTASGESKEYSISFNVDVESSKFVSIPYAFSYTPEEAAVKSVKKASNNALENLINQRNQQIDSQRY